MLPYKVIVTNKQLSGSGVSGEVEFEFLSLDDAKAYATSLTTAYSQVNVYIWDGTTVIPYESSAPPFTGLLDTYGGAAAAYSVRLLSSAWSGESCVRVRVDTTGQPEYNIGFVNNELDTATLEGHCTGGLDAYVVTWYDQSGNGNDVAQTTASDQPKIVSGGSTILENGKPTIYFDGVNDWLVNNDTISASSNYWVFYARNLRASSGDYVFDSAIGRLVLERTYNNAYFDGGFKGTAISSGNHLVHFELVSPSSGAIYEDGTNTQSGLPYTQTAISSENAIGARYFSGNNANINMQEFIIYNTDQSSNRTGIETNINDYYSIY
jgi:hypothetical protein